MTTDIKATLTNESVTNDTNAHLLATHKEKYNFKALDKGEAFDTLKGNIDAGRLTDKDFTTTDDGKIKRNSVEVELITLDMKVLLEASPLTTKQIETMQGIVNSFIASANKKAVDTCEGSYKNALLVLEEGVVSKGSASSKIVLSAEEVKAFADLFQSYLDSTSLSNAAKEKHMSFAKTKYNINKLRAEKEKIILGLEARLGSFVEYIMTNDTENVDLVLKCSEAFAKPIEDALSKFKEEEEIDADEL